MGRINEYILIPEEYILRFYIYYDNKQDLFGKCQIIVKNRKEYLF